MQLETNRCTAKPFKLDSRTKRLEGHQTIWTMRSSSALLPLPEGSFDLTKGVGDIFRSVRKQRSPIAVREFQSAHPPLKIKPTRRIILQTFRKIDRQKSGESETIHSNGKEHRRGQNQRRSFDDIDQDLRRALFSRF